MKKYKANRKGFFFPLIIILLIAFMVINISLTKGEKFFFIQSFLVAPLFLFLSMYFNTYYVIEKGLLKYQSGFMKGNIPICNIIEIQKNKTLWSGKKPALSKNGLIIKYNKFDEIYIAPENNDEMLADLLAINNKILIIA